MKQLAVLVAVVLIAPLVLDCGALLLALLAVRHPQKGAVVRTVWSEVWLLGYGGDLVCLLWWFLGAVILGGFSAPLPGAAIAGACVYLIETRALGTGALLGRRERHRAALTIAAANALRLFLLYRYL